MKKKFIAIFVILIMLLGTFSGCQTSGTSKTKTDGTESTAGTDTLPPATDEVKEIVTLKYYGSAGSRTVGPIEGWQGEFYAKHGIRLECLASSPEKTSAMIASGDLPDLIRFGNNWTEVDTCIKAGLLVNLDEHKDALPNIYSRLPVVLDYVRDLRSAGTGGVYIIPDTVGDYMMPVDTGVYAANVRWDLYLKVGAPKISTIEEFIPLLKSMQEIYPETEEGLKVYGFTLFNDWDNTYIFPFQYIAGLLGYYETCANFFITYHIPTKTWGSFLDDNGVYLRALKFFNTCYKEGLLDPDSITQTFETAQTKATANGSLTGWVGTYTVDQDRDNLNGFRPVMFDEFYAATMGDYPLGATWPIGVSSSTKYLDACLRYINMEADYEACMIRMNGPEGELWVYNADGIPVPTEKYWKYRKANEDFVLESGEIFATHGNRFALRSEYINPEWNKPLSMSYWPEVIDFNNDNPLYKSWAEHYGYKYPIDMIKAERRLAKRPLFNALMAAAPDDIETIRRQVGDVLVTNSWLMIYAKDDNEFYSLWNDWKKTATALGVEKVQNWALEEYKKAIELAAKYE